MTNGHAVRKCQSWIGSFIDHTANLDAPAIFRRWAAINTIASVLEQKVWLHSGGGVLYPNLYTFLVGHPGVGKTRTVRAAKSYLLELPEFHLAPTSMTAAALIDMMVESKRFLPLHGQGLEPLEYNTLSIMADELGAFIHKYDDEMIAVLSAFYDPDPYGHHRRGKDIRIKIMAPQLNILCGTTPSNLLKFLPEGAWEQGFTSRVIMVFSDERIIGDDFATTVSSMSTDLLDDLKVINSLVGQVKVTEDYRNLVNLWRQQGEQPAPTHPKLIHYSTRRRAHLYKLSIIACVDRSDQLLLTREDFNIAMNWLVEAERYMGDIFKAGSPGSDSQAMDDIYHWLLTVRSAPEHRLINVAREKVPAHSVIRILEIMEKSGMIRSIGIDPKLDTHVWEAVPKATRLPT